MERYIFEKLSNNKIMNHFSQCRDCLFRYSDYFIFNGKKHGCSDEYGWEKCVCHIYEDPEIKPDYVYDNMYDCEFYEKDKR